MPDFSFTAMGQAGQRSQGTLTAGSEREVMSMLDSRGLFPVKIELMKANAATTGSTAKVKPRIMANFYAQMADLLRAGVPLLRCIELLERQSATPILAAVLRDVHAKVADGTNLADAMKTYPRVFSELAVSMISAGQEGGFLEDVLERIAIFTENQEDLKGKVIGAMAYPVFLAGVGFIVLNVLVIFFVPQFEPIFKKLEEKGELPKLTIALVGLSHTLTSLFVSVQGYCIMAAAFGLFLLLRRWARSDAGRLKLDRWRLKMPGAGQIYLSLALSRFTRILGTLLHNGIPILQSLRIAKDSMGNKVLTQAIDQAAENVTAGNSLAQPFAACPYFPRDVVEMVAVGEESNQLEKVLIDISNGLEKRTSRQLELFTRLLEPVMLLVMAGITLVVVAGLLLPVFKMSTAVN